MSSSKSVAIADLEQGVILARVDIAASPERVFRALTTSELTNWWGSPEMYRTTSFTIDLRRGGKWRSDGVGADGHSFHVEGEVVDVEPPRRLVWTWRPSWDAGPTTTVAFALDPTPSGTRLTVRHSGFADPSACGSHATGWERVTTWLDKHLAPDDKRVFLIRLLPPRPTFMQDMTAEERTMMQNHGAYWRAKLAEGVAIAFGPVADPKGGWGLGLIKARDEAEVRRFEAEDPAIASGRGLRYEVMPMVALVV
jgi:uncharacterized protein YndB with AHSA1/START domain